MTSQSDRLRVDDSMVRQALETGNTGKAQAYILLMQLDALREISEALSGHLPLRGPFEA